jgi:PPK2 family polyphosphate:nucleotide phosphotransferase
MTEEQTTNAHSHYIKKLTQKSTSYKTTHKKTKLADQNPRDNSAFKGDKSLGEDLHRILNQRLEELQEIFFAEHKQKLLIVLQAMDTGGKDGVVRNVFDGVNPQGVRVASFKVPTPVELDRDYLWRIHKQTPGKGEIVIFNRSHYEDVLVVRVHQLVPESVWGKRFKHINDFERMLVDEGTKIVKFFLNISYSQQTKRLLSRIDDTSKNWKFNPGDLKERKLWGQYMEAYEDVLNNTSTSWAPWYIVPSDRKWYRNLVISSVLVNTLENLKMAYPKPTENFDQYRNLLISDAKLT